MAGKHIYIETILDNLLGGFQTTFDKMIAALDRMIGKTEEDPDGTSLKDVVSQLVDNQNATALLLQETGEKLDEQIIELQGVVNAISQSINPDNVIITANGDLTKNFELESDQIEFEYTNLTGQELRAILPNTKTLVERSFKSYVDGSLLVNINGNAVFESSQTIINPVYADTYLLGILLQVFEDETKIEEYKSYTGLGYYGSIRTFTAPTPFIIDIEQNKIYKILLKFDVIKAADAYIYDNINNVSIKGFIPENYLSFDYDFLNILKPGGIFDEVYPNG